MLKWVLLVVFILIFLLFYAQMLSRAISNGKMLGYYDAIKTILKKEKVKHGNEERQEEKQE